VLTRILAQGPFGSRSSRFAITANVIQQKEAIMNLPGVTWGTPRFTTLVDNGPPDKRLDVAIIGDGYTAAQQGMFNDDSRQVIEAFGRIEPMRSYLKHFNFHRIADFYDRGLGLP
jgi:hypothetical protein